MKPNTQSMEEKLKEEFWRGYAEKFKDSQEILFGDVTDWWLQKLTSERELWKREVMYSISKEMEECSENVSEYTGRWIPLYKAMKLINSLK